MNCDLIHSSMETACKVSSQVAPKMKYPDDWKVYTLNKLVEQTQYGTNQAVSTDGFIPIIGMKEIQNGKVLIAAQKVSLSPSEQEKYRLDDGDILLNRTNSLDLVGKSGVYHQNTHAVFASYLIRLKPVRSLIDSDYLGYYLNSYPAYITLKKIATAAISQANINPTELKRLMVIPCPSLPEQRRIAEFLGTWDEAIEKLEQLIAAKEKQQKVLSNHIFDQVKKQEFQQCRLVNICAIHKGVQLGKFEMNAKGRYPVLNGGISYSGYTDSYNCEANTIAISEGGNSCGFVNLIREKFWCGGHCYTLKNIRISMQYLFFFLKHRQDMLMNLRVGSGLPNIQKKDLENVEVVFPIMEEEQNRFSEILLCTQNELDLLRKKLAALQKQKRGLMQKLLTGTWRV